MANPNTASHPKSSTSKKDKDDAGTRLAAIGKTIEAVIGRFGKGAIMALGGDPGPMMQPIESISTGSLGLDEALGIGGLPRGRIVEVFGPESSGKTTLTLHVVAEAQRRGHVCAFVDAEHALDVRYASALGVKLDELLVSQPDNGEQALEIVDMLARSGSVGVIVVDSVAALVPRAELEGDMGDTHVGLQARLMSQAMRKIAGVAAQTDTLVVFINQLRHKIGVTFGSPETTTGGNALKYFASVRLDIRRIATVKDGDQAVASRVRVKVVKNKMAPPFQQTEFDVGFGTGILREAELLDRALELGIVVKSGSWFACGGESLGQGRQAVLELLRTDATRRDALAEAIKQAKPRDRRAVAAVPDEAAA